MHLLQPLGDLLEALAEAGLQGGLQLLVDGGAHLIELGGVAGLQLGQLRLERLAHLGHAAGVGFAQRAELAGQCVGEGFLQQGELLAEGVNLGVLGAGGFRTLLH